MSALAAAALVVGIALPFAVAGLLWLHVRRRKRLARLLADPDLLPLLAGSDIRRVPWIPVGLVLGAAALLGAALADPRWGTAEEPRGRATGPLVLVLDASTSMLVADVEPSRMAVERALARVVAREMAGSAVGVVVFSGRAYALSPPTSDPAAVDLYLEALDPQIVAQTGSSLAAAVRQGVGLLALGAEGAPAGSVVLLTDGDVAEDEAQVREAAALARRAGVPVHVVGVGTAAGGPVPRLDPTSGSPTDYLRRSDGQPVVSRLREPLLRDVAELSGGVYVAWSEAGAVDQLLEAVRRGAPGGGAGEAELPEAPRYAWFALPALLLLGLEAVARRAGEGRR